VWPRLNVRTKLVLSSLVLLLVVSLAFTAAWLNLAQKWVEGELRSRAIAFAREVAATIGDRREFENEQLLRGEVRRIMEARENVRNIDFLAFNLWPARHHDPTYTPLTPGQRDQLTRAAVARLVEDRSERTGVVAPTPRACRRGGGISGAGRLAGRACA
jgi:hypothetical protein